MSSLLPRRWRKSAPSDAQTHGPYAPSSPPKTLRNSPGNAISDTAIHNSISSTAELSSLLQEMDELVALDRILDARSVVHRIREAEAKIGFAPHGLISPDVCARMDEIMSESNHIDHLLSDLRNDDTWHLVKSRGGGITVHYRNEDGSPIHSVKTHTIIENVDPVGFVRICSLFLESDLFPLWFPHDVIESSDILASPSKFRQILHMKMSFGRFSPLSPRDAVVEGRGYHLVDDNAVLILSSSITESKFCAVPAKTRSRVRVDINAAFYIQFLPGNRVLFRQISHDDLKIRLMPAFLINLLAQGAMPYGMIQSLKAVLRRYEETEFYSRMKQKADLYDEIEDRVHKALASNVSRMDTGNMDSQTEQSSFDEEDRDDASKAMTSPRRVIGRSTGRPGHVAASASTNSNSMSLFATGVTCLSCIFLAQFCTRLSLYCALLPRRIQLVSVACVLSLPIFMYMGSIVSGNRSHGGTIRVKKRDGSIVAELYATDSPERQFMNTLTTMKKSGSRKDVRAVVKDKEMISENKEEEEPTSTSVPTSSEKYIQQKKKKKKPKLLRKVMPKRKGKSKHMQ